MKTKEKKSSLKTQTQSGKKRVNKIHVPLNQRLNHHKYQLKESLKIKASRVMAIGSYTDKLKSAPTSQYVGKVELRKDGSLYMENVKEYASKAYNRIDSVIISSAIIAKCKKAKNIREFRSLLREFAGVNGLRVDSASVSLLLANHQRERVQLYNQVAKVCDLVKFIVEYHNK